MEESFGPVIGIMPVDTEEEGVRLMNDSPYGLTASIWTEDAARGEALAARTAAGTVYVNRCDYLDPDSPGPASKTAATAAPSRTLVSCT